MWSHSQDDLNSSVLRHCNVIYSSVQISNSSYLKINLNYADWATQVRRLDFNDIFCICWLIIIWEARVQSSSRNSYKISTRSEGSSSLMTKACTSAAVSHNCKRNSSTRSSSKRLLSWSVPSTKPTATYKRYTPVHSDQDLLAIDGSQFLLWRVPDSPGSQQTPHHHAVHGQGHECRNSQINLKWSDRGLWKT